MFSVLKSALTRLPAVLPKQIVSNQFSALYHILSKTNTFNYSNPVISNLNSQLLMPITPTVTPVCGFKVKGRLKRRCKDCYFVMRQQRLYVICKTHPRHKQMSMAPREKNTWILTHATMSKRRPW